jgi:3-hydroxyisobutyrate dehydrogenase
MITVEPGKTKIGWVGTGVMGAAMCQRLLAAGFDVALYSRTKSKSESLLDSGAIWADSPRCVAEQSDVVFAIVGMPDDVEQVFLAENGILAGCKPQNIIVDMTTSQPELAVQIYQAASNVNVFSIDAPVSGGDIGAKNGTLSIMIGGDEDAVRALDVCWHAMGKTVVYQGGPGSGQHTKLVNQILVGAGMIGVCESLLYAYKSGLDLGTVLKSVSSGAAGSWALSNLGPRIIANDFAPGFYVNHFVKDLEIALDECRRLQVSLPGLELAHQLYQDLQRDGGGELGTQALQKSLAAVAGFDWEQRGGQFDFDAKG